MVSKNRTLNDTDKETIDKNFLSETPELPTGEKVVVAQEIPKYDRIRFQNMRDGVTLRFHYCSKTHPLKHYELVHGQEYNLPIEVINHLQGETSYDLWSCHSRSYGRRMRPDGISEHYPNAFQPYYQCKTLRR